LSAEPIFEPARVRVRAPKRAWAKLAGEAQVQVYAELGNHPELSRPGSHELQSVRVAIPAFQSEPHVSYAPNNIKATLEVTQPEREIRLPYLVVYPLAASNLHKQYRIECPETIPNVRVVGPPDKIALLELPDHEPKPKAVFDVRLDDATGETRRKRWRAMDLPEGVRVVADDRQPEIEFRLVPASSDR
jgi:hypothetical protein